MVLSLPSDNSGTPSRRTCPVSSLSCNLYSFSLLRCIVSELPCRPTEDCVAACCCRVAGGAVVPGRCFLKDMAWRGRLGSPEEMRLRNEDLRERMLGSISSGSSPTSQDRVRSVSSKQTLKRQYQSFLDPLVEADDEDQIDDPSHPAVKKHRLTTDQVSFLETSFEEDMKLEPERKALLAKSLGLVPRQVAIWFQNRRARWKNKQLEQEYETLKAKYNTVVKENDNLLKENEAAVEENKRLLAEVSRLMILLQSSDNGCSSRVLHTLDGTRRQTSPALDSGYELQEQQQQQEAEDGYLSSGKSDLTFPIRSLDDQSEVLDSGQSYLPTARLVGATETGLEDLKVTMVFPMVTVDGSEDPFESLLNPFLIQQRAVGGLCTEDACSLYFGWEDQWAGFS